MKLLIKTIVRLYQAVLSPQSGFLRWIYLSPVFTISPGANYGCKFETSCSNYCIESINKHGVITGIKMSVARLASCR